MKIRIKLLLIVLEINEKVANFSITYKLKSMLKTKSNQAVSKVIVRKSWKTVQNFKNNEDE